MEVVRAWSTRLSSCLFKTLFDIIPIDNVPPSVDICSSVVSILQVVGMFPDVEDEYGYDSLDC